MCAVLPVSRNNSFSPLPVLYGRSDADKEGPTIFDKIAAKEIPSDVIYEDDVCMAFRDVSPQAPTHFLVIPKARSGLTRLSKAVEAHKNLLGHLVYVAQDVAKKGVPMAVGCCAGFSVSNVCQGASEAHAVVFSLAWLMQESLPCNVPPWQRVLERASGW